MTEAAPADPRALRLPHEGPARLLVEVLGSGPEGLRCRARVPHDSPLVRAGRAPGWVAFEIAAQAAAAAGAGSSAPAGAGSLTGVREAELHADALPLGEDLLVLVSCEASAPPIAIHRFHLSHGDRLLASGVLSTHAGS